MILYFWRRAGDEAQPAAGARPHKLHWKRHPEGNVTALKEQDEPDSAFYGAMGPVWKMEGKEQNEQLGDQGENH